MAATLTTATTASTMTAAHRDGRQGGRHVRWPALLLVLMALLAYTYNIPRGPLANADSHLALTRAIVEGHTFQIDRYAPPDLADRSGYRGHYYTDKDPGLSLLAVPVYAALRFALPETFFSPTLLFMVRYLLTSAVLSLPAALFVALLWRFFAPVLGRRRSALLALGYALGTMAWAFSALLFSHMVAAMALFGAFMLLQPPECVGLPNPTAEAEPATKVAWQTTDTEVSLAGGPASVQRDFGQRVRAHGATPCPLFREVPLPGSAGVPPVPALDSGRASSGACAALARMTPDFQRANDNSRTLEMGVSVWRWVAAGELCGLAVLCEYPSALVAALLALFAAYTALRPSSTFLTSGTLPFSRPAKDRCGVTVRGLPGSAGVSPVPTSDEGRARRPRSQDDLLQALPSSLPGEREQGVRVPRAPDAALRMALFVGAGLTALLPLALYNLAVYSSPFSQGYAHLQGRAQFIGGMRQGVEGIGLPRLDALWGITFSPYRGLFVLSPFLLLALPGLFILWRAPGGRPLALLCGGAALVMLLFNSAYYFWDGGVSLGPRHVGPALPFLLVPVAAALRRPGWWRLGRALIVLSIAVVAACCATVIIFLPLDQGGSPNPIVAVALARLWSGPALNNWGLLLFGLRGLPSLLPLALGEALLALALWRSLAGAPCSDKSV